MTEVPTKSESFLSTLDITVTELAALRGVSRQYATRDLEKFLSAPEGLIDLYRTLRVINTDGSNAMAERLKKFASETLDIEIDAGSAMSTASVTTYSQLLAESNEIWICSESPLELERSDSWDQLRERFLDQPGKLLAYFVPTLEIADRLAGRFETELFNRQFDSDGNAIPQAKPFGATVFIIVTNLVASTPDIVLANPGSGNLQRNARRSVWAFAKEGQDLFELPSRFGNDLVQKARAAGLGTARSMENFFPFGQGLNDAGLPLKNYRNVDQLFGIRLDHPVGLFEGEPIQRAQHDTHSTEDDRETKSSEIGAEDNAPPPPSHPLKFFPIFIRAYRKKAGDFSKILPKRKKTYFRF